MNSRSRVIYSLLGAAVLTACVPLEERTARFERKWPATSITRLEVREVNGTISVDGNSPGEITMVATVHARGVQPKPREENQGYFKTEVDGDTLVIRTRNGHGGHFPFFHGRDIRVDYELRVPASVALELRTVNGRIATRGIAGETMATTVNGVVDIESTGSNEVTAKTVNGRVHARFLNDFHGARLGTVNGRVTAVLPASASFLGDFTQVNGDFEAAFPLNIHSHPGSRRVSGEVNGGRYSLKITTVNGDIKVDNSSSAPAPR
jgi:phenylpropionate dioxygenase-like ring-hydroxylating dioxygenase large terminal subunit